MRIWIDTEFNEYHGALISMALVAEDGREWYGVRFCDDPGWWAREHVMPQLLQQPERDADLRDGLAKFLGQFDAVHIVSDWPGDIAHFCNFLEFAPGERIGPDTMTFEVRRDLPDTATTSAIPHNALEDARALAMVGHNAEVTSRPSSGEVRMKLVLIRGLPGSGKSTMAKALHQAGFEWFEADTFHLNDEGDYCYDPANVKAAHDWCQRETFKALANGKSVVVSNTFTRRFEMEPYFEMAKTFGIEPNVLEATGNWPNVHGVPAEVVEKMRQRWEKISNA